ncbi:helix-turn-helix transcriptional regulator [Pseudaeromonas sp. ZJS20]|uniref:helix-turn-helix transcriptional regulator n=1 Tax=Pseudaeromonas aegiceratis TaxID=3153928 RepID=UPI00390C7178
MDRPPLHSQYLARARQQIHRVPILAPLLVWVRQGTKLIHAHGQPLVCPADHCLCLPTGEAREMENLPSPGGCYQAEVFSPPRAWTERFLQRYGDTLPGQWQPDPVFPCPPALVTQLTPLLNSQSFSGPLGLARLEHAWQGVLLGLAEAGLASPLFNLKPLTLSQRIQLLLQADLARPWQANELAQRLGLSESSMRRALRQEGSQGFANLLTEQRLSAAMDRVMRDQSPLTQIALECGFVSASHFSQKFRQRFGVSPSQLRHSRDLAPVPAVG